MARLLRVTTAAVALLLVVAATIRPISAAKLDIGTVTHFLGDSMNAGSKDGTGKGPNGPKFNNPNACGVSGNGNLYILDTLNFVIRKVAAGSSNTQIVAGQDSAAGDNVGSPGTTAAFKSLEGIAFRPDGNKAFIFDGSAHRVLAFTASSTTIEPFAGDGTPGTEDGSGLGCRLFGPTAGVVSRDDKTLYVVERQAHRVRKFVISSGQSSNFVGKAEVNGDATGTGSTARFFQPQGIARSGNTLFLADSLNFRIRKITTSQVVTTLTGLKSAGIRDGGPSYAQFSFPRNLVVGHRGDYMYVADAGANTIRRVELATGYVDTIAGTGAAGWSSNDNTAKALVAAPKGLCIRQSGSESTMYITGEHSVSYLKEHFTITKTLRAPPSSGSGSEAPPGPTETPAVVSATLVLEGTAWDDVLATAGKEDLENALIADISTVLDIDASAVRIENIAFSDSDNELTVDFSITEDVGDVNRADLAAEIENDMKSTKFLAATTLMYKVEAPLGTPKVVSVDAAVDETPAPSTPAPKRINAAPTANYYFAAFSSLCLALLVPALL